MKQKKLFNIYGATGGNFAGNVYDILHISPALSTMGGGNQQPLIIERMKQKDMKIIQYPHGWNNGLEYNDGICPSITKSSWEHNNFIKYDNMEYEKQIHLPKELEGKKFRIRKLTPRECFRLMGVDNKDIDKMQASGVSNSAQYKLAGNSIVVDVLFHLFRKMFIETDRDVTDESTQLSLF